MIGLRRHTVRLVEHDAGWAGLFAAEADAIRRALGDIVVDVADPQWGEYIRFRDTLRSDETVRRAYRELKSELARAFAKDREAYTAGKAGFIRGILARPRR